MKTFILSMSKQGLREIDFNKAQRSNIVVCDLNCICAYLRDVLQIHCKLKNSLLIVAKIVRSQSE